MGRSDSARPHCGGLALAFVVLYDGALAVVHQRADLKSFSIQDPIEARAPGRVAAFPDTFNPFVWRGLVEGAAFQALFHFMWAKPFRFPSGRA